MIDIPKEKLYKVVINDSNNPDQYLLGFYPSEYEAKENIPKLRAKYASMVKDRDLIIKHTNPEMILGPVATDYEQYNCALIPDEEWKRVMASDASAEICCDNMTCGAGFYYNLSKMIDKKWTVIDIGCGYNAQSYLFQDHARYIAVNPKEDCPDFHFEHFQASNTEFYGTDGQTFIRDILPKLNLDLSAVFCIMNFVPDEDCVNQARATFKNLWVYYPYTPKKEDKD